MIWKSAILLWVAFFLVKYLVRANISTERAFEKLQEQYTISQELLLD